uniref:Uncharacterized protein n=1 Tax=Arundo donax TaxID=35708 RepID=A0A0A8Z764_ARUDO
MLLWREGTCMALWLGGL